MMINENKLLEKWGDVINFTSDKTLTISDKHRRLTTAVVMENTERALIEDAQWSSTSLITEGAVPTNATGAAIQNYDPVTIALLRRAMPNLIAYDVAGVQPMTAPTGLIFAMRSYYGSPTANTEAFYTEANTGFSTVVAGNTTIGQGAGNISTDFGNSTSGTVNFAGGMSTAQGEALGATANVAWAEMSFGIEKVTVTAQTRALKGTYTSEMAQDLRAIHGLDAESELANIISTELLAEINRELIRTIYATSVVGANTDVATTGTFDLDVDSNGRWSVEKFKGLMFQLTREANQIAKDTRRGRGNIIIASSDVVAALQSAGMLDYNPALLQNQMNADDTGNTFAGILNNQFRVYIDPYALTQYAVVGYKGADPKDAGLFYAPYVPLQMARAVDPGTMTPVIGFKTRYGMVANPYAEGLTKGNGALKYNSNKYYRKLQVSNLM